MTKKQRQQNKIEVRLHGEVFFFPSQLPPSAKEIEPSHPNKGIHILADSETTGNHHVLDLKPSTKLYEVDGSIFMTCDEESSVSCVVEERHDTITLDPGVWEFGIQQEYDHLAQHLRQVRD